MSTSQNSSYFPDHIFLKSCVVSQGGVEFTHGDEKVTLDGDCLAGLDGKTVLVSNSLEVFRSDKKIGNANRIK